PCCPAQVSRRGVCMAGSRASLSHGDLAAHPGAGLLDGLTRSRVLMLSRLEEVKDVLRERYRPQGEELVIRIGEGPTAADRHETRVAVFREDHAQHPSARICPTSNTMPPPLHSRLLERSRQVSRPITLIPIDEVLRPSLVVLPEPWLVVDPRRPRHSDFEFRPLQLYPTQHMSSVRLTPNLTPLQQRVQLPPAASRGSRGCASRSSLAAVR